MAIIEVTVCDVCRNPERGTTQFHASEGVDAVALLELCRDHAAPLRELLKRGVVTAVSATHTPARPKAATAHKAPVRRRRTGFDSAVATMEEIEARKQG